MGWNPLRARRRQYLENMEAFRSARKLLDEDISALGEQLTEVGREAAASALDSPSEADYQKARDSYERARALRAAAATAEDVGAIDPVLNEGRYHLACVLARRDGVGLPTRRDPCFFNPQHGPGVADVAWAPPGGVDQTVTICRPDADRLAAGEPPDIRQVRVGDRYVPWYAVGGSIAAIAQTHAQVSHARTADSDPYVNEARARAAMGTMNERLNP